MPFYMQVRYVVPITLVIAIAITIVAYIGQLEQKGIFLQLGNSLSPIVSDFVSWSEEVPLAEGEIPMRGRFYSYQRPPNASRSLLGKIRSWASKGRTATKQCHGVSESGLYWDTGSDDRWVPIADIRGRVVRIIDSRYKDLSDTPLGRFTLWAERNHLKNDMVWVEDNYLAIDCQGSVKVYRGPKTNPIKVFEGWELYASPGRIVMHKIGTEWGESGFMLYYPQSDVIVYPVNKDGETLPKSEAFVGRIPGGGDSIATAHLFFTQVLI